MLNRELINELATFYNVTVTFEELDCRGKCAYYKRHIRLSNKLRNRDKLLQTFFHELGHVYCYEMGIWSSYHHTDGISKLTKEQRRKAIYTGLKAERWIDKWGSRELQTWFPGVPIDMGYVTESWVADWYRKNYLIQYKY